MIIRKIAHFAAVMICLRAVLPLAVAPACAQKSPTIDQLTQMVMKRAATQYTALAGTLPDGKLPRTFEKGKLATGSIDWWCSGFYAGTLWYIYEYSHSAEIGALARKYTAMLAELPERKTDHDIGFQLFCSYGNAYRLTGDDSCAHILRKGAKKLAARFNPIVGSIRSWDFTRNKWKFPVIIDNMMNLELLMWAGRHFGERFFIDVALTHANTTMRNHYRSDAGSFHLVDYDPETGEVRGKQTVQGYADESKWARGQAWGLYGFTMLYRYTHSLRYLAQAEAIADLLIPLLPADGVPYWDYDSPLIPDDVRDASAAAIMASALVELSGYVPDKCERYLATAERQVRTLASPAYLAAEGANGGFLLMHSVGNKPGGGEVDVPLTYADYYFVEALLRFHRLAAGR